MEQPVPDPQRRWSEDEYLRFEETSDVKHEFRNGQVIAMAGGTHEHGIIAVNLGAALVPRLRDTPCVTAGSDVRVRSSADGSYSYPDLTVVCAEPVFARAGHRVTLVNPQVVVEVLSTSTQSVDLGDKLDAYLAIESVREYVVVAQDRPWARSFTRGPDGQLGIGPLVQGMEATLAFRSLGVGVPMAEVYAKVRFPTPGDEADAD